MASPLVETKLFTAQVRPGSVARPRLRDLVGRGSASRMTLIAAPAGFGKTTLLAEWLHAEAADRRVAWVSLDERDSEPASFWTYVVTALQRAVPGFGVTALPLLQSGQEPIETVLVTVLNELSVLPGRVVLVLDDYHLADGKGVAAGMTFLLEHLPPRVHLVISTRADPALPLARFRARGELVEVRAADLRFTPDEAASYLNEAIGLALTAADIAALEERTEGWIAALQLAALSLQGREDVAGFIAGFAGDDRYVVDYLVEEVLGRQPDNVRDFLLQTSVLDRLSGPLCDAVTGRRGGKSMLETLDRANLFVVRLDDSRRWYRYHHLFADVLHTHLVDERSDETPGLHLRASQWYADAGEPAAAVRHALAAGDVARAADLVELAIPRMQRDRQEATIRGWIDDLPDEIVRTRPVLAVGLIGGLMSRGEFDGVEERLADVERVLSASENDGSATGMVVVDPGQLDRLPGAIEMFRAALALVRGDPPATISHAERAIDRAATADHLTRAGAAALSGLARWGDGDLAAAHAAYSVAVDGLRRAGHVADVLGCSITLADIRITQGRLTDAQHTYERALQLASRESGTLRGTADMYVGLSRIAWERGDPPTATEHLRRTQELGEPAGLPQNPYRWRVAMADILQAQGDHAGALDLLDEAEDVFTSDFSPNVRPVPATRARLLITQGKLTEAAAWSRRVGISAYDDLSYMREYEHVTLARLLLARHVTDRSEAVLRDAAALLERLLAAADGRGRTGSAIEILVLLARAHHAGGDLPAALTALERGLTLAEPEGYVRVFASEGQPMTALLAELTRRRPDWAYARRLLDAATHPGEPAPDVRPARRPTATRQALVEPLSDRELEVLRLLATDLDGPGIARQLSVSLNTLRTHTKHIYTKLGVTSRRAAVSRAGQHNLLSRTIDR